MEKKFVPSEHLSDDVNLNIMQSEKDGGLLIKDIKDGESITVQTENTLYTIEKVNDKEYLISGNQKLCPIPTKVSIHGSTWGGSMIKLGFIGIGMYLEVGKGNGKLMITSQIKEIKRI